MEVVDSGVGAVAFATASPTVFINCVAMTPGFASSALVSTITATLPSG